MSTSAAPKLQFFYSIKGFNNISFLILIGWLTANMLWWSDLKNIFGNYKDA